MIIIYSVMNDDIVLNRTKHNKYLIGGTMHHQSELYIAKQLEYITKDHLAMHMYYLNLKRLYSLVS